MKRVRILVLVCLLVLAVIFAFMAGRLPVALDARLGGLATNTFEQNIFSCAESGDAQAQYSVGVQFAKGTFGREKDDGEARHWFEKAAEQEFVPAQLALARLHAWDFVIDKKKDAWSEAADWYRRAAESGSVEAQYEFGSTLVIVGISKATLRYGWDRKLTDLSYGPGASVVAEPLMETESPATQENEPTDEEVKTALEKAPSDFSAEVIRGILRSNEQRAKMLMYPEIQEGIMWLRTAANLDYVDAQVELIDLLNHSPTDALAYEDEVKHWRLRAASLGHADTMCELGVWYKWPTRNNFTEAIKWLEKAAERGSFRAMDELAELYLEGKGVPKDVAQAARFYQAAAGAPDDDPWIHINFRGICIRLGFMAEQGDGLPRDLIEAYKWYNLAASGSSDFAKQQLASVSTRLTREQIAEAQKRSTEYMSAKRSARSAPPHLKSSKPSTEPKGSATGFFVTDDGWICTCYHVVRDANKIAVHAGAVVLSARVVKWDAKNDLALLKVEGKFRPLNVASRQAVSLGESVFTIGYPNIEIQGTQQKLTRGEVSSLAGIRDDPRHYQISVPVQPGNSGGPLVDLRGNMVGVVVMRMDDVKALEITGSFPQNVNYAIKAEFALALFKSVPGLSTKLQQTSTRKERSFDDVVKQAQEATALLVIY